MRNENAKQKTGAEAPAFLFMIPRSRFTVKLIIPFLVGAFPTFLANQYNHHALCGRQDTARQNQSSSGNRFGLRFSICLILSYGKQA
jgi:hypothetical protein